MLLHHGIKWEKLWFCHQPSNSWDKKWNFHSLSLLLSPPQLNGTTVATNRQKHGMEDRSNVLVIRAILFAKKVKLEIKEKFKNSKNWKFLKSFIFSNVFPNFHFFQIFRFFEFFEFNFQFIQIFQFQNWNLNFDQTKSRLKSGTRPKSGHEKIQTLDLVWTSTDGGHLWSWCWWQN